MAEKNDMQQIGDTGLKRYGGYIDEEFLRQLKGKRAIRAYREMRDNDDIIGGILFVVEMLLRNVEWRTDPASDDPIAVEIAEFVDSCRDDMSHSWSDFIAEVLSMLPYGFSVHEIVYKERVGPSENDGQRRSKYTDGLIGWRKMPIRAQESIYEWNIGADGSIDGLKQQAPATGAIVDIPIEKLLLFRTTSHKNNPEGRSIIRNAYIDWHFKKNIKQIEAIGIERDLAGLPVAHVPPELLSAQAGSDEAAALEAIKAIVRNIRRDEQEGVIWPLAYDADGNLTYKLELLSSSGARQFDTNEIISRYDKRIAATVMADFIMLGQDKVGSYSLSSDKTDMFAVALGAWLKSICDVLNRFAIPRLLKINNMPLEHAPEFAVSDVEKEDIEKTLEGVSKMVLAGVLPPDEDVENKVRDLLDLPRTQE